MIKKTLIVITIKKLFNEQSTVMSLFIIIIILLVDAYRISYKGKYLFIFLYVLCIVHILFKNNYILAEVNFESISRINFEGLITNVYH